MNGRFGAVLVGAVLSLGLNACAEPQVVRVYDGKPVTGRFIEYEAYAAYGRGLEAELDRHYRVAARWYQEAAKYDPKSAEIQTHLGGVLCALGGPEEAEDAFVEAERLDPKYAALFRVRAQCASSRGRNSDALAYITRAFALDPDDGSIVAIYATLLKDRDELDAAARLLDSFLLRYPNSGEAWRVRGQIASKQNDALTVEKSVDALARLAPHVISDVITEDPSGSPLAKVDAAIRRGNIDEARKAARMLRLPPGELAIRAAAIGATKLAKEQAEHVLGADPASMSARVALASSSDALEDSTAVSRAFELPKGERLTPLSPLGRLVFAELLVRHAEREAARAFLGSLGAESSKDPLYEALRLHLVGRLGGTNPVKVGGT